MDFQKQDHKQSVLLEKNAIEGIGNENGEQLKRDLSLGEQTTGEGKEERKEEEVNCLKKVKSVHELKFDLKESQKVMQSLSSNIDDLFKKISSLTQQIQSQPTPQPQPETSQLPITPLPPQPSPTPTSSLQPSSPPPSPSSPSLPSPPSPFLSLQCFQLGPIIGSGKFADVILCRHKQTGLLFVLKKILLSTITQHKMHSQIATQMHIDYLDSQTAPILLKVFKDEFHLFLLMEYYHSSNLATKFKCSEQECKGIIREVLGRVGEMHCEGVVHRDLKAENLLIDEDGRVKVCDFGWAYELNGKQGDNVDEDCQKQQKEEMMEGLCGTIQYVTPEMVNNKKYTKATDLWNVGILTYQLLFGSSPFHAQTKKAVFEKVKNLEYNFPQNHNASKQALDFIKGLLQPEQSRLSLSSCLEHPFLSQLPQRPKPQLPEDISELVLDP